MTVNFPRKGIGCITVNPFCVKRKDVWYGRMPVSWGSDIGRFYCTLAEVACYCSLFLDSSTAMIHVMLDAIVGTSWSVKPSRGVSFQFSRRSANICFEEMYCYWVEKEYYNIVQPNLGYNLQLLQDLEMYFRIITLSAFIRFFFSKLKRKRASVGTCHRTKINRQPQQPVSTVLLRHIPNTCKIQ